MLLLQPPVEGGVPLGGFVVFNGDADGFAGADQEG